MKNRFEKIQRVYAENIAKITKRREEEQAAKILAGLKKFKRKKPKNSTSPKKRFTAKQLKARYNKYIRSDAWRIKRMEAIRHHGQNCGLCKKYLPMSFIEVHHLTYKRFTKEKIEDLMVVCRPCHEKIHKLYNAEDVDTSEISIVSML